MKQTIYHKADDRYGYRIGWDGENRMISLVSEKDPFQMNWVSGDKTWGTIQSAYELDAEVVRGYSSRGTLTETYTFYNRTGFDIYTIGTELGIYAVFPDYYTDAEVCMRQCCNTHIWCGGNSSYIMALRMGGMPPHLGLILREGRLKGYSIMRGQQVSGREENVSNCRGSFLLHPENFHLKPGETYTLSWELVWFADKEDFIRRLRQTEGFISVCADTYLVLGKQPVSFSFWTGAQDGMQDDAQIPQVFRDGRNIPCRKADDGRWEAGEQPAENGEYSYEIFYGRRKAKARFLVMPPLEELAEKRCRFIAQKQQCMDADSCLYGAYLIYDNEEQQQYYGHQNDHNGARERIGMGTLLAYWLQKHPDSGLQKSLEQYLAYVLRELFDEHTGEVYNDAPKCNDYIRLYNYPWMGQFFLEAYGLWKEDVFLDRYFKCMKHYYEEGGAHFYAIGIPMYESIQIFKKAGREEQAGKLLAYYKEHGAFIISCGRSYPPHEVDFEQSIVAPAASYLCELYRLTGEDRFWQEAEEQLKVLDLFHGFQPDYHMHASAIRHWDGYWFGKRGCLGDTFPHYWSALTGCAYMHAAAAEQLSKAYSGRASNIFKGILSLFREDGSASCAMLYPMSVNGKAASFYDPWANDQDWGMYFALKYHCGD